MYTSTECGGFDLISSLKSICFDQEHPSSVWVHFELAAFPLRAKIYRQPDDVYNDCISRISKVE